jgi:hypothetical protein
MENSKALFWPSKFPWVHVWQHFVVPGIIFIWSKLKFATWCSHRSVSTHRMDAARMRALGSTWLTAGRLQPRAMDGLGAGVWGTYEHRRNGMNFGVLLLACFPSWRRNRVSEVRSSCVCLYDPHFKLTDSQIRQYEHYTVGGHPSGVPLNFLQLAANSGRASLGSGSATAPLASYEVKVRRYSTSSKSVQLVWM